MSAASKAVSKACQQHVSALRLTEFQQSCNRAATELRSCKAATELEQTYVYILHIYTCYTADPVFAVYMYKLQQICNKHKCVCVCMCVCVCV